MVPHPRRRPRAHVVPLAAAVVGALAAIAGAASWAGAGAVEPARLAPVLPAVEAVPMRVDTLMLGGYARGSFAEALPGLAELTDGEREMIGRHLDRIYAPILRERGLEGGGRLRLAYERTVRPDGTTRSIQVLAAEAAVGGQKHTVFLHEGRDGPGYYDDLGRSLDPRAWARPLEVMRVTSGFRADRMHPILKRVLPHNGIDIAAPTGTPVRATGDGSISHAAARGGYGLMVEVQHANGYSTRYAHLSRLAVRPGAAVRQGDVIGYVGMTGLATGPHLHYEVRRKGRPVDPAGVQVDQGPLADVGYDAGWRAQRRHLARLLARAPTVVSARANAR